MRPILIAALQRVLAANLTNIHRISRELIRDFFPDLNEPDYKIVNNTIPKWLGRAKGVWEQGELKTVTVSIQKAILDDEDTLRRVLAHELVHCWEYQSVPYRKLKMQNDGHGRFFKEEAARLNSKLGPDYVTTTSDQSYVMSEQKPFYILIQPHGKKHGVSRFIRPSKNIKEEITKRVEQLNAHVFETKDADFGQAVALKKYGGYSIFRDAAVLEKLRKIYEEEDNIDSKFMV